MAADGAIAAATAQGEITGARFFVNNKRCNFLMQACTKTWASGSSIRGSAAQRAGSAMSAASRAAAAGARAAAGAAAAGAASSRGQPWAPLSSRGRR